MIAITIPGEPLGKARPRWAKYGMYTPKKTVNYEVLIKEVFIAEHPDFKPIENAVAIHMKAYYAIPSSASKKAKEAMLAERLRPTKRPDYDNVLKVFSDALNGIAYKDDGQIVTAIFEKYYSDRPRVELSLSAI